MTPSAPPLTPLVEELLPCPDSWDVARKLAHLPHLLFLDSSERHTERGRYSYVMADPIHWNTVRVADIARCNGNPLFGGLARAANLSLRTIPDLPPFQGGTAFMIGYGANRVLEKIADSPIDEFEQYDLAAGVYPWVIGFDHVARRSWIIWHDLGESTDLRNRPRTIRNWGKLLATVSGEAKGTPETIFSVTSPLAQFPLSNFPGVTSNFSRDRYVASVRKAIEYIHAGDIFQVNLSQRLLAPLLEHPFDLYGRLRQSSPAPFACYFDTGDFQIVSASPEQFLKVTDGEVITRPIKGTRPRGRTPREDEAQYLDLVTDPKDRAENVMIVDLLRNDLGRVCEYGSVHVPRVCEVESYNYVHHLVSEVRGKLRADQTPFDLLRAAFPGGSVTGAPKVRAMEIIAELEPTARGSYCGSIGTIGFNGAMDSNILIRTFTAGRGWLQFPVGGGIVADSDPVREYEETLHKAAGLLRALKT